MLFLSNVSLAQQPALVDTSLWVIIYTTDGNEFSGQIIYQNAEQVSLKTEHFGDLIIPRKIISSIRPAQKPKLVNGRVVFENPHTPRYFVGTSAYGLRKGEGCYENGELFLNQVSYGLSDQFSLGVGFAPFFLFFDGPFPVWITPKFSIPIKKDKMHIALSGLFGHEFNDYYEFNDYGASINATYLQFTYGSRDANITGSIGLNLSNGRWAEKPIYSLAGTIRILPRLALLGESYFLTDPDDRVQLHGIGLRFMGRRIAFDAGLTIYRDDYGDSYPLPWGSLHIPFGRPKN